MQQPVYLFQHPCKRLQTASETTINYNLLPLLRKEEDPPPYPSLNGGE